MWCPPALAERITWPVPVCRAVEIETASPAPLPSDSASLSQMPFVVGFTPRTAALVIGIERGGEPVIHCAVVDAASRGLENAAVVAVAGLKFAVPSVPNVAVPEGRYLVRVSTLYGMAWMRPPPPQPLLPPCTGTSTGPGWFGGGPEPVERIRPVYPIAAEREGIEGSVTVKLEVYSNGDSSPLCISRGQPAGWFEAEAVRVASGWRFRAPMSPGLRSYTVTLRFRLE